MVALAFISFGNAGHVKPQLKCELINATVVNYVKSVSSYLYFSTKKLVWQNYIYSQIIPDWVKEPICILESRCMAFVSAHSTLILPSPTYSTEMYVDICMYTQKHTHSVTRQCMFFVKNRMLVIGLCCLSKGMWAALMISMLPVLCVKTGSSSVSMRSIRGSLWIRSYLGSMWFPLVIQYLKSKPESVGEITQIRVGLVAYKVKMNGAGVCVRVIHLCVTVHVHWCCIYMCLIPIYTLCDSQYKSFYEHLYQSDGSLGTLGLLRSDCYISVTALPLLGTLTDEDIDRLYYSLLPLKPYKILISYNNIVEIMIRLHHEIMILDRILQQTQLLNMMFCYHWLLRNWLLAWSDQIVSRTLAALELMGVQDCCQTHSTLGACQCWGLICVFLGSVFLCCIWHHSLCVLFAHKIVQVPVSR